MWELFVPLAATLAHRKQTLDKTTYYFANRYGNRSWFSSRNVYGLLICAHAITTIAFVFGYCGVANTAARQTSGNTGLTMA
jgi:hypothetical protein